jgi:hypothetical protein
MLTLAKSSFSVIIQKITAQLEISLPGKHLMNLCTKLFFLKKEKIQGNM